MAWGSSPKSMRQMTLQNHKHYLNIQLIYKSKENSMKLSVLFLGAMASGFCYTAHANSFIDDSSVNLTARNFYFDRDYKENDPVNAARDWAQGFILKANSGYTPGLVGVGLDITALAGFNLAGSRADDYAGSGLLPVSSSGKIDQYGEIRWTAKAKVGNSTVHTGTLTPMFPVLFSSPARLFQQNYRGTHLQINEIENLKLHGLYVDRVNQRDSTDFEKIRVGNPNGRFDQAAASSGLYMLGGEYKLRENINTQVFHANLHDVYQQSFVGTKMKHDIGFAHLVSDLRLFVSEDSGQSLAGKIDNQHLGGLFGFQRGNGILSLGYMQSFGDTAMPTLAGSEPAVFLDSMSADFSNKDERVYSARFDYDFKDTPLSGLKFMTRYSKGIDIDLSKLVDEDYKQRALDTELSYHFNEGALKGLNLRLRHTRYRSDLPLVGQAFRPGDETRLNVDYTWKFK